MSGNSPEPKAPYLQHTVREADNQTKFYANEAPEGSRLGGMQEEFEFWYERLWAQNEGWNGIWRDQREVTREAKVEMIEAVALQLDLSTGEKERSKGYMRRVNGQRYSNVGGLHMVAMCLCQIVVRNDDRNQRYYHPLAKPEDNDALFSKLVNEFGIDLQQMANTIQKLRCQLSL